MVKKIPFDLIKEGQFLKLDIGKMMTVEQMLKMPTLQVLQELRALSITVMTALLSVSVHEEDGSFRGRSQKFYADKIQELLYKGHSIPRRWWRRASRVRRRIWRPSRRRPQRSWRTRRKKKKKTGRGEKTPLIPGICGNRRA